MVDHRNRCHLRCHVLNLTYSCHVARQCYTDRDATFDLPSRRVRPPCQQPRICSPSAALPAAWSTGAEPDSRWRWIGRGVAGMKMNSWARTTRTFQVVLRLEHFPAAMTCLLSTIFDFSETPSNFGGDSKELLHGSGLRKLSLFCSLVSPSSEKET